MIQQREYKKFKKIYIQIKKRTFKNYIYIDQKENLEEKVDFLFKG